jgi:hypothetical protein
MSTMTEDPPAPPDDAHRGTEVARLAEALAITEPGLQISGISGPGGVGKSYLLAHVLESRGPTAQGYLRLSVDGSNEQARGDFFGLLESQLAKPVLPPPARSRHDYFPHLRRVAYAHRALVESVSAELGASGAPPAIRDAAIAILKAGRRLNKAVPMTRGYFDAIGTEEAGVAQTLDDAWNVVASLRALQGSPSLPGPLRDLFGSTLRARVKTDLYNLTADALVADLEAALDTPGRSTLLGFAPRPIPGKDRLLLVVDDFEALAPTLEEFLVGALIPRLADAPFATALVILGRDELEAMHPAWGQHCRRWMRDGIRLAPFDHDAALDLLAKGGVPEARREEMFKATQGFPFLLGLLIEELGAEGADSALFLRKFFDRTTRWMSAREREWFAKICYLEEVNLDTLAPLFPGEAVEVIQDWFEREASIRDPAARVFRVRPLIREKVLRYLELRSPSRHREREERAAGKIAGNELTRPG